MKKLLFHILRHNIRISQLVAFCVANLLGGSIILFGLQVCCDYLHYTAQKHNTGSGYMVITKQISNLTTLSTLAGINHGFSEPEIAALQSQDPVQTVGRFETVHCGVYGTISVGDLTLKTDMFLEAVPTEYIDVAWVKANSKKWSGHFDDNIVPVIVPRNYLNLYNYGYATTHNMPLLSENLMQSFPFKLELTGDGGTREYEARVIGFSQRLNTILVPLVFLQDVNSHFAPTIQERPSRLIIELIPSANIEQLLTYFAEENYVVEGDTTGMQVQAIMHILLVIIIGVGVIISLLAIYLLTISVTLLIERNKDKMNNLYIMGYNLSRVARPYTILILSLDGVIWLLAACCAACAYSICIGKIQTIVTDFIPVSQLYILLFALFFAATFMLLHKRMIYNNIRKSIG